MRFFALYGGLALLLVAAVACGDDETTTTAANGGSSTVASGTGGMGTGGAATSTGGSTTSSATGGSLPSTVTIQLTAQAGVTGMQRVNVAVPLGPGQLMDPNRIAVSADSVVIPAGRRALAARGDGSLRAVQLQVDVNVDTVASLSLAINADPGGDLVLVPVADTLMDPNGESGPRVWATLPGEWLSQSGIAGPMLAATSVTGNESSWNTLCDYATYGTAAFLSEDWENSRGFWLYDRGTALYRGYAGSGDLGPLRSAYQETSLFRNRITGTGTATRNGIPTAGGDVKYAYAQNLALHYLLTGDERFREGTESMALGMSDLWPSPGYAGGADFWTERHAGFSLLAYVWAARVSDDQSAAFWALADDAVAAYINVQDTYPIGYADTDARCFAHDADAHGESYGYFGCSPWMSAILADGLDAYIRGGGTHAAGATQALVKLGTILAREGRDPSGKPYYWMGVDTASDEVDGFDEHIGESAYVVAMAWHHQGKTDATLRTAAEELVNKFASDGTIGQLRSFNWQCRSAVATPWFLAP